jgi:hypothetical protein
MAVFIVISIISSRIFKCVIYLMNVSSVNSIKSYLPYIACVKTIFGYVGPQPNTTIRSERGSLLKPTCREHTKSCMLYRTLSYHGSLREGCNGGIGKTKWCRRCVGYRNDVFVYRAVTFVWTFTF